MSTIIFIGREVKLRVDARKTLLELTGTAYVTCRRQERSLQGGSSMTQVRSVCERNHCGTIVNQKEGKKLYIEISMHFLDSEYLMVNFS